MFAYELNREIQKKLQGLPIKLLSSLLICNLCSYLIANGSINKDSILFFDEPEVNLNPKMIRHVTSLLLQLAEQGKNIFRPDRSKI